VKLRWTRPALADLINAHDYIARDNPTAAQSIAQKVWDAANYLCDHPGVGRRGHVEGTSEWVVSGTPYLIVYRVKDDDLQILRIWHGRRNWQNNPST
jgi:addiction module RelE/StbE family toxin